MITFLHGYFLEGSGSNLWTRHILEALAKNGLSVNLLCQENHPEKYPFLSDAYRCVPHQSPNHFYKGPVKSSGGVTLYKPEIGKILPVFVEDDYEEFDQAIPIVQMDEAAIESYINTNLAVLEAVVKRHPTTLLFANHLAFMPTVAERFWEKTRIPYVVIPHGSALEYAVKKSALVKKYAESALRNASKVAILSKEIETRIVETIPSAKTISEKAIYLSVGVDTRKFQMMSASSNKSASRLLPLLKSHGGRSAADKLALSKDLSGIEAKQTYETRIKNSQSYHLKSCDADLVQNLGAFQWGEASIITFVGRVIAAKGLQVLIASLPYIFSKSPGARLIVVGSGPFREPAELWLEALSQGNEALFEKLVGWGSPLEPGTESYFNSVTRFLSELSTEGKKEYFRLAKEHLNTERIVFAGHLNHDQLSNLLPLCDAAVFPSHVPEVGPMVFLEALASGCIPMGTNIAGMKIKIDTVDASLPSSLTDLMRINPKNFIDELAKKVPEALKLKGQFRSSLREVATRHFDWQSIAKKLAEAIV